MSEIHAAPPDLGSAPEALTPGSYLKLRREAAALTIQHVVLALVPATRRSAAEDRADLRNRIMLLEEDALHRPACPSLVDKLGTVFSFVPGIYWLLLAHHDDPGGWIGRPPRICRGCGCSQHDACIEPVRDRGEAERACAWSARDSGLCTACEQLGILRAAPSASKERAHAA
jgi:hypothetical protein